MKIRMMDFLPRFLLLTVITLVLCLSCAFAENRPLADAHVELISEGYLPTQRYGLSSRGDLSEFNAYILSQLKTMPEEIDISTFEMTLEEFRSAYRGLLNTHPEMFYVSGGFSYYPGDPYLSAIIPKYKYTGEELADKVALYNRHMSAIMNYANKGTSIVSKLLRASDYICVTYEYDTSLQISSPEEMFEKGRGVCQAYTMIYAGVCNELGVTNSTTSSTELNHIWNLVNLGGSWYHVDVTWNDPVSDVRYRAMHNHFLRSDAGITETGHYGWDTAIKATSTKYDNYFWQDLDHAAPMLGDLVYFTPNNGGQPDGRICTGNVTTGEVKDFRSYDATFYGAWFSDINPLWATSSTIYYGLQDTVYAMPMEGGDSTPVFSLNDKNQYLFYFYLSGNTMYLTARTLDGEYKASYYSFNLGTSPEITLDADVLDIPADESSAKLTLTMEPVIEDAVITWTSSNEAILTVDVEGNITPVSPGIASVTAKVGTSTAECQVIVHSDAVIEVPENTTLIDAEAFADTSIVEVILPKGLLTIGESTFANCAALRIVIVPDTVTSIAANAFDGCENVTLLCVSGSAGEAFAIDSELPYLLYTMDPQ